MRSKLLWGGAVLGLFGVAGLWVLRFKAIFFSPDFFLPRDSYLFHWRIFDYVSQYLKFFNGFPEWDFRYGISLIPFGNNFLLFMPYRWVGYALVAFFGVDSVIAYKFSFLIFGQGLFLLGIFLFHKTLLKSKWAGLLAVVLACLSSLSFALFHQEQMLGTLFFVPWVGWALLKRYWILALALLGFSLNCHYPQLLFIYYGICFLGYGFFVPHRTRFRVNHTAILCFLVALGPLIYSYARYNGTLRSSFRDQQRSIEAASFEDYERVNKLGPSSVHPRNFSLFLQTTFKPAPEYVGDMDNLTFHATLAFPIALALCLLFAVPYRGFVLFTLVAIAVSAMGIHGPMPKVFWYTVPGIKLFRQYYHLLPLFTLNAILLTTICLFHFLKAKTPKKLVLGILLLATALVYGAYQTKWATEQVEARLLPRTIEPPSPSDSEQFLTRALFDFPLGSPLAMPKDATLPTFDVLSKRFIPWWQMKDGSLVTALPQSILMDGFRMTSRSIPNGASAIKFLQYDDGNWVGPLKNSPDKLVTISAENLHDGVSLQRNPTFWPYLLFLMWSAVAFAILHTAGKRKKAGSSAPSPISNQKLTTITDVAG